MQLFEKILPLALGIIMFGLGLSLTLGDFRRVAQYPRAVIVGLICQMLLLPLICFGVAAGWGMAPVLAVGLMLLAASPGGATSNAYSHFSGGDVALNITITAVNSLLTLLTLPLIVNWSMAYFLGQGQYVPVQFSKVVEVFAIVLVPVTLGMLIKARSERTAERLARPVRLLSLLGLVVIVGFAVVSQWTILTENIASVFWPVLVFNLLSLSLGYFIPRMLGVEKRQAISLGMEIGIHNGTLAIYIALNVLGNQQMMIPAAIYSLVMFFTAAGFGWLVNRRKETDPANTGA